MRRLVSCIYVIVLINLFCSCKGNTSQENVDDDIIFIEQQADSSASAKIDSVYEAIQQQCDTAKKYRLPLLIDSILNKQMK